VLLWWTFAMTAVLVAPLAVLLSIALVGGSGTIRTVAAVVPFWLGIVGVVGLLLIVCAFEFVGPFEPSGWKLAGTMTPITYIVWSVWLIGVGIALLL